MGDLLGFPDKSAKADKPSDEESDGPYMTGVAFCVVCGHEWMAVAPTGTVHLECPACHRLWGLLKHAIRPDFAWTCQCGEQLFWLTPAGALCRGCGLVATDWADAPPPR